MKADILFKFARMQCMVKIQDYSWKPYYPGNARDKGPVMCYLHKQSTRSTSTGLQIHERG